MIEALTRPDIQQFIRDHEHHDPFQLVLQAHKYPGLPIKAIAEQIRARQKAKTKLPEWYHREGVLFPSLLSLEQCSSEATAVFKSTMVSGQHLVDLTGGAGIDTYYLSRSFTQVDYIEKNKGLAAITTHNFQILQAHNIHVHATEAEDFLTGLSQTVDCIYVDPARRDAHAQKVFQLEDCAPDVVALRDMLLSKADTVLIKTSPMLDIEAAVQSLHHVSQVFVVAHANECKEVLYLLKKENTALPEITAVNLLGEHIQKISFTREAERSATVHYSAPLQYIYEPNAAILKAGAFQWIAQAYALYKLHPHTHLYTSDQLMAAFPGRIFRCEAVTTYHKKAVRSYLPDGKASITTRNFPDSVQQARKKLGVTEGGSRYLFLAVTEDKPKVIICTKF